MVSRAHWSVQASWYFYKRHPGQALLALLGLALGVAIATSVALATDAARTGFELSTEALYGRATHQITGGSKGVEAQHYRALRRQLGLQQSAPVIEGMASVQGEVFSLLGVAPLAEAQLRPRNAQSFADAGALHRFVTVAGAVAMDQRSAERLGVRVGDTLKLRIDGQDHEGILALTLPQRPGSGQLLLTYLENARHWLARSDTLDRIDLRLSAAQLSTVQEWLPPQLRLRESAARSAQMRQMTSAFNTNLRAMSLLALLVGAFLIHNTMSFVVISRRQHYAMLRSLGVTRQELLFSVLREALLLAFLGACLGAALGLLLAQQLLQMVTQTINDLYFVLSVRELSFSAGQWLLSLALGTAAGTLPALTAALDAAQTPPGQLARHSALERHSGQQRRWQLVFSVLLWCVGAALLVLSTTSLVPGFAALFAWVLAYALLVPSAADWLLRGLERLLQTRGSWATQHAVGAIRRNMSRYGVALAALSLALAATVGVDVMVGSFRGSLISWLDDTLQADIYLSVPSSVSARADADLPPELRQWAAAQPEVDNVSATRNIIIQGRHRSLSLNAVDPGEAPLSGFSALPQPGRDHAAVVEGRAVQISESLAHALQLAAGSSIELFTDRNGWQSFAVAEVVRDYANSQGTVLMHRQLYNRHWADSGYSSIGLQLRPDADHDALIQRIRRQLQRYDQSFQLYNNRDIQQQSLAIFDRTFAITEVLRLLIVGVAFVGLFSALMSVLLEKTREFAVLRALGATLADTRAVMLRQALLIGALAGSLALPLGLLLATLLTHVINQRSFGWSIDMQLQPGALLLALALGLVAALAASVWPLWRLQALPVSRAMRMD